MRTDVHQHFWSEPLVAALGARDELPFARSERGLTVLYLAHERPYVVDVDREAPAARAELLAVDGVERALLCLSSPLGIEWLPRPQADALIEAFHEGALSLGDPFGVWGAVALADPDPGDVDRALARGCVGISVPAGALAGAASLAHVHPVLERLQRHGAPLLVHPGPGRARPGAAADALGLDDPLWWPALTDYVAGMQAAWLAFATVGRPQLRRLRVIFTMLAGLAPLHTERLRSRGGPARLEPDPLTFYDTSSYGPDAASALAAAVGSSQLLYGSDRPIVESAEIGLPAALDWAAVDQSTRSALGGEGGRR